MIFIKKLDRRLNKSGKYESCGLFLCPYCLEQIERLLSNGKKQKSCGCMKSNFCKKSGKKNIKHGGSYVRLYTLWLAIKQRCLNSNAANYNNYGGRGITVCDEWKNSYENFRDWSLNNGYNDTLEIDRKNTNGNYEPNNCRWVTDKENNRSRRNVKLSLGKANEIRNKYITGNYTQIQLGKEYNISISVISGIINNRLWI